MADLIPQRNSTDCTICCLAMAFEKTYEEILALAEDYVFRLSWGCDKGVSVSEELDIIRGFGYGTRGLYMWHVEKNGGDFWRELKGEPAILRVPSLNFDGGYHSIYWDGHQILDPSMLTIYTRATIPRQTYACILVKPMT